MQREQILDVLSRRFALYVLMEVREHPGASKRDVTNREPLYIRTKFERIDDLVEAGLISENREPRQHATVKLYLTPEGQEIADCIARIVDCAKGLPDLEEEDF